MGSKTISNQCIRQLADFCFLPLTDFLEPLTAPETAERSRFSFLASWRDQSYFFSSSIRYRASAKSRAVCRDFIRVGLRKQQRIEMTPAKNTMPILPFFSQKCVPIFFHFKKIFFSLRRAPRAAAMKQSFRWQSKMLCDLANRITPRLFLSDCRCDARRMGNSIENKKASRHRLAHASAA